MKVIEHLRNARGTLFSFEILPPLKGKDIRSIYEGVDPLLRFKPSFINVTYHREEVIYKDLGNGLSQRIRVRKRPGTVGICAMIKAKYDIDTVPHLICGGFSREETEALIMQARLKAGWITEADLAPPAAAEEATAEAAESAQ